MGLLVMHGFGFWKLGEEGGVSSPTRQKRLREEEGDFCSHLLSPSPNTFHSRTIISSQPLHPSCNGFSSVTASDSMFVISFGSMVAVNRIYEIKGRKYTSPLAICVADVSDITRFAVTNHLPHELLNNLLPGPVTVVLKRGESSILEKSLNPGFDSIGVRVPDSNFIRIIARSSGSALALTSANLSGQPSSVSIKDFENLWQHCAYVYDGGLIPSGPAGSTVVDLSTPGIYKILRPGSAMEETVAVLERFHLEKAL
ncbi:uncharacterized protein LOC143890052 isoform X2 [Tasmannia lanceolata]|uniref:uncharacterized protein LOC143890052 isoform X2 n=1 Tax=Tasmannia lanceolata TaxID=3420 RepID=UPI0040648EC0